MEMSFVKIGVGGPVGSGKTALIERLTREMKEAAKILEFEQAAFLRDRIEKLRKGK